MEGIKIFFDQADNFILWINALFFTGFLFVQSTFFLLKNLKDIKAKSIYAIYNGQIKDRKELEAVEFIDYLYKQSKVLVLPAKRNDFHYRLSNITFFIIAIITIFNKPLSDIFQIPEIVFYIIYLPFLGYAISFLVYKFILFKHYYSLQKSYFDKNININSIFINFNSQIHN